MAISWGNVQRVYRGPISIVYAEATLDNSYLTGGEVVTATDIGLTKILALIPTTTAGYDVTYAKTNDGAGLIVVYASLTPDTSSALATPIAPSIGRDFSSLVISCVVLGNSL